MGATNHTTNYNLSQFIGTDKPSWLNDYNGDMSAIDTAIKNAADAASLAQSTATNADSTATSASNTASALATQINTPVTGLAAQVSDHDTSITNINTLLGNTPLTTTAQTVTGAIEEVKSAIPSVSGVLTYLGSTSITKTYDGNTTIGDALDAVYTDLVTAFSALASDEYIKVVSGTYDSDNIPECSAQSETRMLHTVPTSIRFYNLFQSGSATTIRTWVVRSGSGATESSSTFTPTVITTNKPASGSAILTYEKYKVNP